MSDSQPSARSAWEVTGAKFLTALGRHGIIGTTERLLGFGISVAPYGRHMEEA